MVGKRLWLLFIILQFAVLSIESQIARLAVTRGSNVNFIFNSLSSYNNGVSYPNWTKIAVYYNAQSTPLLWKLQFKSLSANILGSDLNSLSLDVIRVSASNGGPVAASNYYGDLFLTTGYQTLVSGGNEGSTSDNIVNLSFDAGVINKVKNAKPDYYTVEIAVLVIAE